MIEKGYGIIGTGDMGIGNTTSEQRNSFLYVRGWYSGLLLVLELALIRKV